jgi:curved DNA-binding protein CbpA
VAALAAAEIRALEGILDELDYYRVLEVRTTAPASEIRAAYHRAARRYHPDGHRDLPPDLRDGIARIAKRVAEAYSVLRDPRRRKVYDERLQGDQERTRMPLVTADAEADRRSREEREGRTPNGRRYFVLAQGALARGDRSAAERNLRTALTFEPNNEAFRALLDRVRQQR